MPDMINQERLSKMVETAQFFFKLCNLERIVWTDLYVFLNSRDGFSSFLEKVLYLKIPSTLYCTMLDFYKVEMKGTRYARTNEMIASMEAYCQYVADLKSDLEESKKNPAPTPTRNSQPPANLYFVTKPSDETVFRERTISYLRQITSNGHGLIFRITFIFPQDVAAQLDTLVKGKRYMAAIKLLKSRLNMEHERAKEVVRVYSETVH